MSTYLGIDVGTTAIKALVADAGGTVLAQAVMEYGYTQPRPRWAEQDPEDWWECLKQVIAQAVCELSEPPVALALSTQGDTMVPVDAANKPLLPARLWMDGRTGVQVQRMLANLPQDVWRQVTGTSLGEYCAAATLAWWADEAPEVFAHAARFCLVQDFLVARMTGEYLLDASNASRTCLYDLKQRDWSDRLLAVLGVGRERLSQTAESATPIGTLTPRAAAELHLPKDTLVVLGAHDQTAGAVGCGSVSPGTVMLATGTAWVVLGASDKLHFDMRGRLQTYCHATTGGIAILGAYAGGSLLRWARDNLSQLANADTADYADLVIEAEAAETAGRTPLVLLPYFYGTGPPLRQRHASGAILGLQLQHTRGDLYLAILRGVAAQTAAVLNTLEEIGYQVDEVRMIGGGAQSDYWAQLVADAHGHTVKLPAVSEAAAFGAAMLAAVGAGDIASAHEVADLVTLRGEKSPRENTCAIGPEWQERYAAALAETWGKLATYRTRWQ
jgi:xylulokinase